jgi:hypothetical protein
LSGLSASQIRSRLFVAVAEFYFLQSPYQYAPCLTR